MRIDPKRWQQLSPWLDQVLDLPAAQRDAWLDDLAGREPALAAELRALLAGTTAGAGAGWLQGSAPAVAAQVLAGRRIGAYTLVAPLGEGGMGAVWLARRSDGRFEGHAAVKLLHAGLVQRALAERFRREGAILARLAHPHIARLVDAGLTDDGQPYLVLEHIAGERIDRWCDARKLDVRQRIVVFAQVLQAVQHAHSQLVVHRDLKPANVMVDEQGSVKLLDFGIAKLIDDGDAPAEATELTRDGGRVLTPLWAAPEQTSGEAVSTATDVYALGLLLFLLLTGQHPRVDAQGQQAPPSSAGSAALPLASGVVTDSGRRSNDDLRAAAEARGGSAPARLAHALAGDLDNILAKALRAEPRERYATVAAFADDLQRHLEGHTVSARPDSMAYRVSRFVGRHRLGVGLSTAALMAILGMAGLAEHQRRAAERERDIATRQRANAEAVAQFMEEQLGQTDEPGRPTDPLARVDRAQRRAEQLFFDTPEVLVPLQDMLSNLNFALGREEAGRRNLQAIAAMAPKLTDPVSRALALCLGRSLEPQAADALARVDRALQALPAEEGSRHVRSLCLSERSAALHEAGRYAEALRDIEAAHEVAPLLMRRMREMAYWRGKGLLLNEMGQPHASDQAYARVVELMHAAGRAPSVRLAQDLIWRAITHWRMGRPREGLRFAEQATAAASGTDGASSVPFITMIHARLQLETGQFDDARRLLESVMLRNGRLVPPYPRYWDFVAPAHRLRGEHAAAIAVLERDLREHRDSGYAVRNAINAIALAQELLAAREADRALAVLRDVEGNPALQTFRWEAAWARAQALNLATGRAAEAEAAARAAVTVAAQRSPPQGRSALHGHAHLELARALAAQGRDAEARAAAGRAAAELEDALGPQHSATRAAMVLARR